MTLRLNGHIQCIIAAEINAVLSNCNSVYIIHGPIDRPCRTPQLATDAKKVHFTSKTKLIIFYHCAFKKKKGLLCLFPLRDPNLPL